MSDNPYGPDWFKATDGKWYPPQPGPPPMTGPPPGYRRPGPPKKGVNKVVVTMLACCGLFLLFVLIVGLTSPKKSNDTVSTATPAVTAPATTAAPTTSGLVVTFPSTEAPTTTPTTATPTTEAPTTAPPPPTPPPTTAPPTTAAPALTPGQDNARRSAQQYLQFQPFSRLGLIDQLSSQYGEGYAYNDAVFAVDSLGVNWNEQAVKSAKQYLKMSPFSRQGLIEQLASPAGEKFTYAEAVYGVNGAGL